MSNRGGILTEVIYPFGRAGALNTTGIIYGTTVSTAGSTSFIEIEKATLQIPNNGMVVELELGLTMGFAISVTTDSPKITYNIKDSGQTSYDSLVAFTSTTLVSLASTTALTDFVCSGFKTPSNGTYFTGKGSFDLQATIATNASTSKASGAMKQNTYLRYSYYLVG